MKLLFVGSVASKVEGKPSGIGGAEVNLFFGAETISTTMASVNKMSASHLLRLHPELEGPLPRQGSSGSRVEVKLDPVVHAVEVNSPAYFARNRGRAVIGVTGVTAAAVIPDWISPCPVVKAPITIGV